MKKKEVEENRQTVYVMTADRHFIGHIDTARDAKLDALWLTDAAWVADTGRFSDFIAGGEAEEVEPIGLIRIMKRAIVGIIPVPHKLPLARK